MSYAILNLCWPLPMSPSAKAVLVSLADQADDQGYCWPSLETISKRTCLSRRAVIDAIQWLEASKIVAADRTNGRHTKYRVTPDDFVASHKRSVRSEGRKAMARAVLEQLQMPHGCGNSTGAVAAPTDANAAPPPVQMPPQPVQMPHTNHQEPSLDSSTTIKNAANKVAALPKSAKRGAAAEITLKAYLAQCQAEGKKPIPDNHAVRRYAADVGLSDEMLEVAWLEFRDRHLNDRAAKRYKDWCATFAASVKSRWYKLWYIGDDGKPAWTSTGLQARTAIEAQLQREQEAVHG